MYGGKKQMYAYYNCSYTVGVYVWKSCKEIYTVLFTWIVYVSKSGFFQSFKKGNNDWQRDLQKDNYMIHQFLKPEVQRNQRVLFHGYTNYRQLWLVSESMQEPSETAWSSYPPGP